MRLPIVDIRVLPLIRERDLSLTISLPYCNFRCPWCHVRYIVFPENIIFIEDKVLRLIIEKCIEKLNLNWVLVTGGEPTLHSKAIYKIFNLCHECGVKCVLDTNLTNPNVIELLLDHGLLNYVHCDVKAPISNVDKYSKICGLNPKLTSQYLEQITKSLKLLANSNINLEIRTVVVPNLLTANDILQIIKDLLEIPIDFNKAVYVLEQFTPTPTAISKEYRYERATSINYLNTVAKLVKDKYGINVYIRLMNKFFSDITRSRSIVKDFINGKLNPNLWEYTVN